MHYSIYTYILGKKVELVKFETYFLLTLCLPKIIEAYGKWVYVEGLTESAIKTIGRLPKTAEFLLAVPSERWAA